MPSINNNPNSPTAFSFARDENGEIKVENGQTQVVLETNNKKYRVTVKGSDALLKDEAAVKKIALELLLLANVYDLGGKTQALTLKNPTDLGQTILEQTRTQAKERKNDPVTTHQGNNLIDILQKRETKLIEKNIQKTRNPATSKSTKSELLNKLTSVRNALNALKGSDDVWEEDEIDYPFDSDMDSSQKLLSQESAPEESLQEVDENETQDAFEFFDEKNETEEVAQEESTQTEIIDEYEEGDVNEEHEAEEILLKGPARRETSLAEASFEGTIVTENLPPSRPPPPPPPPRLPAQGTVNKEPASKANQTGTQQTSNQAPKAPEALLGEIRKGISLKKPKKTNPKQEESKAEEKYDPITQALQNNAILARELAKRKLATEGVEEGEESGNDLDLEEWEK